MNPLLEFSRKRLQIVSSILRSLRGRKSKFRRVTGLIFLITIPLDGFNHLSYLILSKFGTDNETIAGEPVHATSKCPIIKQCILLYEQ